jgi:hypothetical protein
VSSTGNPLKVFGGEPYELGEVLFGTAITKGPLTLPQATTQTLFTVTNGAIIVTSLAGLITTQTPAGANNLSLGTVPAIGTAASAGIGGPTAINSLVAGTWLAAPASAGTAGGALVAPGVPASGTASTNLVTNNYHGTVDVTLSGFTVTHVYINGVQAGTTNATYSLPQHGNISITYSVVGTWTWVGSAAIEISASSALSVPKDVGFIVPPGTITWTTTASLTGAITWYMNYVVLDGSTSHELLVT